MRAAVLAVVLLVACGGEKKSPTSFAEDMKTICEAPTAVGVDKLPPGERQAAMAKHIAAKIHHPEAISLFESLAYAAPVERPQLFRKAVDKAGVKSCPLLDQLELEVKEALAAEAAAKAPDAAPLPTVPAADAGQ